MQGQKSYKDKIIFLDGFYSGGPHLFLYEGKEEQYPIFRSFLEIGLKNNELCVYTFPREPDKINLVRYFEGFGDQFHQFPLLRSRKRNIEREHISMLYRKLMKLTNHLNSRGYRGIRLEIDFGDVLRNADLEVISGLEKYSQKFGEIVPVSHLCALDIGSVDQEILERLMGFHDRMFISVGEGSMVSLSHSSPQEEPIIPSIDIMSQDTMERCVKSSLDVIVLSLLQQEPMCGFDVIKTIVQRFNVLLSQGVVYPLLYSLKEQGYLTVEVKPDHKTRVYVPTEIGREFIKEKLMEYSAAQKRILDLTASSICEEK